MLTLYLQGSFNVGEIFLKRCYIGKMEGYSDDERATNQP